MVILRSARPGEFRSSQAVIRRRGFGITARRHGSKDGPGARCQGLCDACPGGLRRGALGQRHREPPALQLRRTKHRPSRRTGPRFRLCRPESSATASDRAVSRVTQRTTAPRDSAQGWNSLTLVPGLACRHPPEVGKYSAR